MSVWIEEPHCRQSALRPLEYGFFANLTTSTPISFRTFPISPLPTAIYNNVQQSIIIFYGEFLFGLTLHYITKYALSKHTI